MRWKRSYTALLTMVTVILLLVTGVLLRYRTAMTRQPAEQSVTPAPDPVPVDSVFLPRLSPSVPWRNITFHKHLRIEGRDTLRPIFNNPDLFLAETDIYPSMYENMNAVYIHPCGAVWVHKDSILASAAFSFNLYADSPWNDSDVYIAIFRKKRPSLLGPFLREQMNTYYSNIQVREDRYGYMMTYSGLYSGGLSYFCCREDEHWITAMVVDHLNPGVGDARQLLGTIRTAVGNYYRDLNRRYAEGAL